MNKHADSPAKPASQDSIKAWFITGTDTGVGKTFVTCALLHALKSRNIKAVGMKPVASGTDENGKNEDVELITVASSITVSRELINTYLFHPPIAPHIAAAKTSVFIEIPKIISAFNALCEIATVILVEGAGGLHVPLGPREDTADLIQQLGLPVIMVVGMRLGCINHALLTEKAIRAKDLPMAGWVANCIDPEMACFEENLEALEARINAPLLGVVPPRCTPELAATYLALPGFE